jgi:putative membrane protein
VAQKQGTSPPIRNFGQHMVNDHSKANTGLKEIATQKGAAMPIQLSEKQDVLVQHLEGLSGVKFDQA